MFGGVGTNMPFIMLNAVLPGSACARDGRLRVGDKLLQCDLDDLRGASQADALAVLQSCGKQVSSLLFVFLDFENLKYSLNVTTT